MTALTRLDAATVAAAMGLPCLTLLALMFWAPGALTPTTFALVATLFVATAALVTRTWRSARGTVSVGQLPYETDAVMMAVPRRTRWDKWVTRYDRSAALGQRQAIAALSVTVTFGIVWTWLT